MNPDHSAGASAGAQMKTLERLYLTLMFRTWRLGKNRQRRMSPVLSLAFSALIFAFIGLFALGMGALGFTAFAGCVHAMTFLLVGMNLAATSGSILFSNEEADVLLHRPVSPKALLVAKVRVIVRISMILAVALNVGAFIHGVVRDDGAWLFLPAHLLSLTLEVTFCASFVVLAYNLCLRWFGRERLDNLMTSVQVLVAVMAMAGGQIVPRIIGNVDFAALSTAPKWLALLPPVWFGALDTVLSGRGASPGLLALAACGVAVTFGTAWLGLSRLAATYEQGLVMLNEAGPAATKPGARRGRAVAFLLGLPLIRNWVSDPVERTAFRLTAAELGRARGVKLRIYPMLAQFLGYPLLIFVVGTRGSNGMSEGLLLGVAGALIAMLPVSVLDRLRPSEDWRAADLFRQAPLARPSALFHGTRKAVILLLCLPGVIAVTALALLWSHGRAEPLLLILPGLIGIPVFSLLPGVGRIYLPFSDPAEQEANNSAGCLLSAICLVGSFAIAGLAAWASAKGWFGPFIAAEVVAVALVALLLRRVIDRRLVPPER